MILSKLKSWFFAAITPRTEATVWKYNPAAERAKEYARLTREHGAVKDQIAIAKKNKKKRIHLYRKLEQIQRRRIEIENGPTLNSEYLQ